MTRSRAMVAVAYAFAVTMLGTTLPTPLYPIYQHQIHFSDLIVTVVFAAYGFGVLAALVLVGPLSDRFGRKALLLPGLALAAASSVVFLLAHGLALLFLGRVLSGLSAGIFTGTATAALLDLAPPEERGRATLIATVVNIGGLGLGPLVAGALAQLAPDPLRLPYVAHLALLAPAVVLSALIPEPRERDGDGEGEPHVRRSRVGVPAEVRATFLRAATAAFAAFATLGLFSAVAPAFMGKLLHLPSHLLTGVVVFAVFTSSAAGQAAMARFSTARALPLGCALMIAGMAVIALSLALSSLALLILGGVTAGFGNGLSFRAGLASLNAQTPAGRRGEVNSSFFVVAYLAISLPIIGVGAAAQAVGLRTAGFAFTGIVALLSLIVLLSLSRLGSAPTERGSDDEAGFSSSRPGTRRDRPRSAATAGSTDNP